MNVVKILLVIGLGYVALTQKVEKTRNMLLVVTGLLAFCMFSVEGLMVSDGAACIETAVLQGGVSDGTAASACAAADAAMTGVPENDHSTCESAGSGNICSYTGARPAEPADLPVLFESCTSGKVVKTTAPGDLSGGLCEDAPSVDTVCADKGPCTADKCNVWSWGVRDCPGEDCGEKCADDWWGTYCEPPEAGT
jgi:hypothetical protein